VLAGHTHGGQICLPGGWPIITHDTLPRRYAQGVHRWKDSWLIVSRGIGFSSIPLRTWCSGQVMEIVLVARDQLPVASKGESSLATGN